MITEISEKALLGRINRKLAHDGQKICKSRPRKGYNELGDYFIIDVNTNFIVHTNCDLELYAKDLGIPYQ